MANSSERTKLTKDAETENNSDKKPTPLPWGPVLTAGLVLMSTNMNMVMVFPLIPFMVADFFPDMAKEELGYKVRNLRPYRCMFAIVQRSGMVQLTATHARAH